MILWRGAVEDTALLRIGQAVMIEKMRRIMDPVTSFEPLFSETHHIIVQRLFSFHASDLLSRKCSPCHGDAIICLKYVFGVIQFEV